MNKLNTISNREHIQNRIFSIRGIQVMLDSDLAEMYGVELKRLNEQVKRNIERFPESFRFQLTYEDDKLKSQNATIENEDKSGRHRKFSKQLKLDSDKFNSQYPFLKLKQFTKAHDRFLIIDETEVYHIGASLKDLGKKWFAFSKIDKDSVTALEAIQNLL